ncbi:bifunctional proline dehydrogenase/L-glutamate gamma-semialdehyde dehydrogenase PutA [Alteromonas oceanisediminis]|uniref:bifunctional proline dehydrogenase/L-glutamate gamma-semialdehyde dehydrogenase PutA n=1 Tax=Alteromonas oceanisediminis TaxID=2836180 RepID=UPI001BD9A6F1|nr:bifunctional proline dehydrogenase/L-glutamate gamma-semialdehyde dehydrogenase PutA [Alteromonas oceanisediminis]MBT0585382.1 bifunctional proline dehydrogenase/L-glutamate gamma-semialdehyde dehydrogenase PutA [Alteromonas oceanisediminis]
MLFSDQLCSALPLRQAIRDYHRIDEEKAIDFILPEAEINMRARSRAWDRARKLVLRIRKEQEGHGGVDALLNEYSLSTSEGVVLMCLAEALLRVPDKETQEGLIRDKLAKGKWAPHLGNSDSFFVNASSWGLLLTGNMVNYADKRKTEQFNLLEKTMGRLGEPVIRRAMNIAMKVMGRQFVMGETIDEALKRAREKEQQGYVYSYDMLGEGARTSADAERYFKSYEKAIHAIGKAAKGKGPRLSPGISVKLSAIHPRYEFTHRDRVLKEIPPKLLSLCLLAKEYDINLTVDAEESERLDISLDIIEAVFRDPQLGDWSGFGLAVQSYQKRAIHVIEWLRALTVEEGRSLMVRLVKGAYWDTEIKASQQGGLDDYPVFTRKSSTDVSYHACANRLLAYRDSIYPQFATHNAYTASVIIELAGDDRTGFEFQCLHGMGDTLYDSVVNEEKIQCRIYAPVGDHEDLLAYLVRRLLENGANSSFVNAIIDDSKPVESLLEDPVERTQRLTQRVNPNIRLPKAIFAPERVNSAGIDITDLNHMVPLKRGVERFISLYQVDEPTLPEGAVAVRNPANQSHIVGYHEYDTKAQMQEKLAKVTEGYESWHTLPVAERAHVLNRIGDALERHRDELIALCIVEAGKVTQDAIDEIREAVDFCRYYAVELEKVCLDERLLSRGVVLAISPWNFPLAIFLGQVVAALAAGNTVIAKPAEQTALIARRAVDIMYLVGLPEDAVQLVISDGAPVGETLLPDERVNAVMFTGSTQTATLIARTLAKRSGAQVPLIAETGGQNCMIVDSTALPEQVVDDVVHSGFQSAGQRCSALRVLYLQEEIADKVITMLVGAMKELSIGDPRWLSTDVGPVIDKKALDTLQSHIKNMEGKAKLLHQCDFGSEHVEGVDKGHFFPPTLYEIESADILEKEVFGPIIHVVRFKANQLEATVEKINALGYGLTMGVHSRIDERAQALAEMARVGNVYINRNIIGAVVGVQPFGGRGLSGTGPKAGGPNYLPRLMLERKTPSDIWTAPDPTSRDFTPNEADDEKVDQWMQKAAEAQQKWRRLALNDRISFVRQMLAKLARDDVSEDYAEELDATLSGARKQLTLIEKLLKKHTALPGPTGEANELRFESRGVLLGFGDTSVNFDYWVLSLVTALATGNAIVTVVSDAYYGELEAIKGYLVDAGAPPDVLQVARPEHLHALLAHPVLAGVVVDSQNNHHEYFCARLAEREGPILPVITSEYMDNLIVRLMTEKTISIDTTASGGNTSLMTLVDDD